MAMQRLRLQDLDGFELLAQGPLSTWILWQLRYIDGEKLQYWPSQHWADLHFDLELLGAI